MTAAQIMWIDPTSGEGEVQIAATGEILYLHYTCITGMDKNNYIGPTERDRLRLSALGHNSPCMITVYENVYSRRVDTCALDL